MAAIDNSMDRYFRIGTTREVTLQKTPTEQMAQQLGPWAKLIGQRLDIFADAGVRTG